MKQGEVLILARLAPFFIEFERCPVVVPTS